MSYQNLGFLFSLLLHLIFAPFLLYINKPISQESKTIALDFELNSILISGRQDADTKIMNITEEVKKEVPGPADRAQEIKSVVVEELPPEKVTEIVEEEPSPAVEVRDVKRIVEVEPNPVYAKRVTKHDVAEKIPAKKDELREISKSKNTSQKIIQNIANQYIKKNFDYINKLIRLNISYPNRARKMFMEGNVIVTFMVRLDGSIKDVYIKKSSGYSILDNNVIRAVKKAAPFPPPPVEATIIIPITYRLGT